MKNVVPIHLYDSIDHSNQVSYAEVSALWLEVRSKGELNSLKSGGSGPPVIPVIRDPSHIEACLSEKFAGIALPFHFKDDLLMLPRSPAQAAAPVYFIDEEFQKAKADAKIMASLNRIESAISEIRKAGIRNLFVDIYHPDPVVNFKSNQYLKKKLGLGHVVSLVPLSDQMESIVRNTLAISALFYERIGSVLLIKPHTHDGSETSLELGKSILATLKLHSRTHTIISCPGCGRCQWDLETMARRIKDELDKIVAGYGSRKKTLEERGGIVVAVMGCNVNGPGEARSADIGIAGGKNNTGTIFKLGLPYKTVKEEEVVSEMVKGIREVIERKLSS
jgi:4-hydroxy-3-methylbut-2-en-1-yl diphosphate synthase IspG/GcpE